MSHENMWWISLNIWLAAIHCSRKENQVFCYAMGAINAVFWIWSGVAGK